MCMCGTGRIFVYMCIIYCVVCIGICKDVENEGSIPMCGCDICMWVYMICVWVYMYMCLYVVVCV